MPESRHRRIRFSVNPRDIPAQKAARRLHLTEEEFEAVKDELFARNFPRPDPTTGMYDLDAIDVWMTRRHNLDAQPKLRDLRSEFEERLGKAFEERRAKRRQN